MAAGWRQVVVSLKAAGAEGSPRRQAGPVVEGRGLVVQQRRRVVQLASTASPRKRRSAAGPPALACWEGASLKAGRCGSPEAISG